MHVIIFGVIKTIEKFECNNFSPTYQLLKINKIAEKSKININKSPAVACQCVSSMKTSLKILFKTMISHKICLEVQKKFFCIKNIFIQQLEVQKPETGQKTGP